MDTKIFDIAKNVWMLGEKTRHFGYYLINEKHLDRGQYTIKDLVGSGEFENLVKYQNFIDLNSTDGKRETLNMLFTYVEICHYFKKINENMQPIILEAGLSEEFDKLMVQSRNWKELFT